MNAGLPHSQTQSFSSESCESILRIYYDFEFIEDGRTIDPISVGMTRSDGGVYYAVFAGAPWDRVLNNAWLTTNVWPQLPVYDIHVNVGPATSCQCRPKDLLFDAADPAVKTRQVIADEVRQFITGPGGDVQLWADFAAYDHVALAQLWGTMSGLPDGAPMYTNDIQQEAARLGIDRLPAQKTAAHHALNDALYCQGLWTYLFHAGRTERETSTS